MFLIYAKLRGCLDSGDVKNHRFFNFRFTKIFTKGLIVSAKNG
jgi:hypothetical protein